MAKASITKREVVVTLDLSEREAQWLADLMQNELHSHEDAIDQEHRESLFEALKEAIRDR